jgi:tetratricopeptide (TPR) repeat protein
MALTIASERALAHHVRAGVLLARQAPEQALRACEFALGFDRNLAVAHTFIGQIKISLGRAAETEAHVDDAVRLSPRDPRLCFWHLTVGYADLLLNGIDRGLECWRMSVQLNPRFWISHVLFAGASVLAGHHGEARRRLNRSHSIVELRIAQSTVTLTTAEHSGRPANFAWKVWTPGSSLQRSGALSPAVP